MEWRTYRLRVGNYYHSITLSFKNENTMYKMQQEILNLHYEKCVALLKIEKVTLRREDIDYHDPDLIINELVRIFIEQDYFITTAISTDQKIIWISIAE